MGFLFMLTPFSLVGIRHDFIAGGVNGRSGCCKPPHKNGRHIVTENKHIFHNAGEFIDNIHGQGRGAYFLSPFLLQTLLCHLKPTKTAWGRMVFMARCSLPDCVRWHSSTNT